jgi:hypothetical protein
VLHIRRKFEEGHTHSSKGTLCKTFQSEVKESDQISDPSASSVN